MKVLHVCQNYYPSKGGPQYTMQHVSEKLVAYYNDDVSVVTTNSMYNPESILFKKIEPSIEIINKVKLNRVPFNRWHYPLIKYSNKALIKLTGRQLPYRISSLRYTLDSPAIDKAMKNTDADVIMATTINYNFCNYPLWRFNTKKPKPFVLYGAIHLHKEIKDENDPSLVKARACDCYIANTQFEKNTLINHGVKPHKIVTIGTGIDTSKFDVKPEDLVAFKIKHGIKHTDIVIGYVGRLVKGKGVAMLIEAFIELYKENKNLKLLLAGGTTEYVAEINSLINEQKLPIILIENFEEVTKPILYHALDIFVLASQSESFGVVFLEAWACKKPVVGTNLGAVASLVSNNVDGILFDANNKHGLSNSINILAANEGMRHELGLNGFKKAVTEFSWPTVVGRYRDAYLLGISNYNREYNNFKG